MGGDWIILRCAGPRTLPLTKSLDKAGFEVWTPRSIMPRKRAHKSKPEIEAPIVPTFVFAKARHLGDLIAIRAMPVNPHHAFSIFQHDGRIPVIGEVDIAGFRAAEAAANTAHRKAKHRTIATGPVKLAEDTGAYAGLSGVIERAEGKYAVMMYGGKEIKISSWLLPEDGVRTSQSHAARAA